ncbi:MAG: hypothetical protein DMG62_19905 [Acidobacteria bacterium]|nr:MAG: hypothetical protein DMG63_06365 [Acidobacteriota bacterium]PYY21272.1 MAG: hypothetical protein DMG62_19905 [Acidobacteriota bacterium]
MSGGGKMISHRLIGAIAILFCTILTLAGQDLQDAPKSAATLASSQRAAEETNDLKADVAKMRALLGQMQRNVAFVSTGDTPLKHQFELEIDMWQLVLRDMEKKLNSQQTAP